MLFTYQDKYVQDFFIEHLGEDRPAAENEIVAAQRERAKDKLEFVLKYARTHRCRRQMILDYFGDASPVAGCNCDVCQRDESAAAPGAPEAAIAPELTQLIRQILSAIARVSLRGQFGIGLVAEVLAGADNERIQRWRFNGLSVHGLLRLYSVRQIIAMLHRIMEAGLARQRDPEGVKFRPVVELTAAGIAVMKDQTPPPSSLADLVPRYRPAPATTGVRVVPVGEEIDEPDLSPEASTRFDRLRRARAQLARQRQLPAYVICHDRTLKLIAAMVPEDLAALEGIKGMGPRKIEMYGRILLEALRGES
jgi:ATP-dependent DNA helicase RecQ